MFVLIENNIKCFWLLVLISFNCVANARQIRYNRYNTEVMENSVDEIEVEATVREIKLAPYPASGFKPSRAFPLPNEATAQNTQIDDAQVTSKSILAPTTEGEFTTTTEEYESEATTINSIKEDHIDESNSVREEAESEEPMAPYPPAGFQPKIPFLLPTNNFFKREQQQKKEKNLRDRTNEITTELPSETNLKVPYPAAGYRPSKDFLLPSEHLKLQNETRSDVDYDTDNSNHPVCGSSTNPLAPTPPDGEKTDPDSELINIYTTK